MKWQQLVKLGLELPEVDEGVWYRTPALKVRGKNFCRLKENGEDVVFLTEDVDEQQFLCASQPAIYFITDHYKRSAAVLARLSALRTPEARFRLSRAWALKAPKSLLEPASSPSSASQPRPTRARSSRR